MASEYFPKVLDKLMSQYTKEQLVGSYYLEISDDTSILYVDDPATGQNIATKEGYDKIFFFPALNRYILYKIYERDLKQGLYAAKGESLLASPAEQPKLKGSSDKFLENSVGGFAPIQTRDHLYIRKENSYIKVNPTNFSYEKIKNDFGGSVVLTKVTYTGGHMLLKVMRSSVEYVVLSPGGKVIEELNIKHIIDFVEYNGKVKCIGTDELRPVRTTKGLTNKYFIKDYELFGYMSMKLVPERKGTTNPLNPIRFIDWNNIIALEQTPDRIHIFKIYIGNHEKVEPTYLTKIPNNGTDLVISDVQSILTDYAVVLNFRSLNICVVCWHTGATVVTNLNREYDSITVL